MKLTRRQLNALIESLLVEDESDLLRGAKKGAGKVKDGIKKAKKRVSDFKDADGIKGARQRRSDKIAAKVAADMYGDDFAAIEKEEAAAKKAKEEAEFQRERQKSLEAYDEETAAAQAQKEYSEEETKKTFDELKAKAFEYRQDTKSLFNESKYYAKYIDTLIRECYFRKNVDYSLLKLLNEADQPFNPLQDPDTTQRKRFELGADRKSAEGLIQTKQAVGKDAAEKSKKAVEKAKEVGQGFVNLYKDTKEETGSDNVNYIEEAVIFYSNILRDMADEMTGLSGYDESTIVYVQSLYAAIFDLELEFEKVLKLFTDKASPEDSNKYSMKLVKEKIDDAMLYYENQYTGEEFQAAVDKFKAEKEEADAAAAAKKKQSDEYQKREKFKADFEASMTIPIQGERYKVTPYSKESNTNFVNILNIPFDKVKISQKDPKVFTLRPFGHSNLSDFLENQKALRTVKREPAGENKKILSLFAISDPRFLLVDLQYVDLYLQVDKGKLHIDGAGGSNHVIDGFVKKGNRIIYVGDEINK